MALTASLERLLENPLIYAAWQAPFAAQKFAPVERALRHGEIGRVLDVGCGPGTNAARFKGLDYVGVDINERYLAIARSKHAGRFVQADLAVDDLTMHGRFDTILVNSFLHHLPDTAVDRLLSQLETLLEPSGRVHILELVLPARRSLGRLMATLDRGRYARPLSAWHDIFCSHFEPVVEEPYGFGGGLWAMLYFQGRRRR